MNRIPAIFRRFADGTLFAALPTIPGGGKDDDKLCVTIDEHGTRSVIDADLLNVAQRVEPKQFERFQEHLAHMLPSGSQAVPVNAWKRVHDKIRNKARAKRLLFLDDVVQGFIAVMVFTECHLNNEELDGMDDSDFADETRDKIENECARFLIRHAALLQRCVFDARDQFKDYGWSDIGADFWYSRNGHGVGFSDRGNNVCWSKAQETCGYGTSFGELTLYVGDDGLLYLD